MKTSEQLKAIVKDKYGAIANQHSAKPSGCCQKSKKVEYSILSDGYEKLEGYDPESDYGLGCGLPTQYAQIALNQTVLDLGSGAGNDCFVARRIVGESGSVIGIDFTEEMIQKARQNAERLGYSNVSFRLGDIEDIPVDSSTVDVAISNCVLNLVPDKKKAFSEILRILKTGGHFSISDVVSNKPFPDNIRDVANLYSGCISGALTLENYLSIITNTGFIEVIVQKKTEIAIPEKVLNEYLSKEEIEQIKQENLKMYSVTVFGRKP